MLNCRTSIFQSIKKSSLDFSSNELFLTCLNTGERTRTSTVPHSILSRARLPFRHAGVSHFYKNILEAPPRFELGIKLLQSCALPLGYGAIFWSGRRESNPRPSPWQGDALPLSHVRIMAGDIGFEPMHDGVKVRCLTAWLIPKKTKGRSRGIEPPNAGSTNRCVNHFATIAIIQYVLKS